MPDSHEPSNLLPIEISGNNEGRDPEYERAYAIWLDIDECKARIEKAKRVTVNTAAELEFQGKELARLNAELERLMRKLNLDGTDDQPEANQTLGAEPLQRSAAQDAAILESIRKLGVDPQKLPKFAPGLPGIKSKVKGELGRNQFFAGSTVFDKSWERLRRFGDIKDED